MRFASSKMIPVARIIWPAGLIKLSQLGFKARVPVQSKVQCKKYCFNLKYIKTKLETNLQLRTQILLWNNFSKITLKSAKTSCQTTAKVWDASRLRPLRRALIRDPVAQCRHRQQAWKPWQLVRQWPVRQPGPNYCYNPQDIFWRKSWASPSKKKSW